MVFRLFLTVSMVLGVSISALGAKYENVSGNKIQALDSEVVNSSPLEEPESARMRKKRQQMEMETEEEFVRKLEEARIEDERIRREQLLREERMRAAREREVLEESYTEPTVTTNNEVTTTVIVNEPESDKTDFYVSIGGGAVNYPLVGNMPNLNGAAALALGLGLGADFWLEGSFLYSYQEADINTINTTRTEDIDHFSFGVSPKYTFGMSQHWITPVVGLNLAYTYRSFNGGDFTSNALDGGFSGGLDLALNKSVKIGFEGRYMTALDYQRDAALNPTAVTLQEFASGQEVKNIEENDYWVFLLNAKMMF